jgi:hypothetical protein
LPQRGVGGEPVDIDAPRVAVAQHAERSRAGGPKAAQFGVGCECAIVERPIVGVLLRVDVVRDASMRRKAEARIARTRPAAPVTKVGVEAVESAVARGVVRGAL